MSIPIGTTPVLKGKEAAEFLKRINDDLNNPVGLTPAPKLKDAIKLIRGNLVMMICPKANRKECDVKGCYHFKKHKKDQSCNAIGRCHCTEPCIEIKRGK